MNSVTYKDLIKVREKIAAIPSPNIVVFSQEMYDYLAWSTRHKNVHRSITNCKTIPKSIRYRGMICMPTSAMYLGAL